MLRKEDAVAVGYREFEVKGVVHSPGGGVIRALTTPAGKPCSLLPAVNFRQKPLSLRNPAAEQQRQAKADERAEQRQRTEGDQVVYMGRMEDDRGGRAQ